MGVGKHDVMYMYQLVGPPSWCFLENSYPVWSRLTCATCLKNLRKNRVTKCASRTIASIGVSAK